MDKLEQLRPFNSDCVREMNQGEDLVNAIGDALEAQCEMWCTPSDVEGCDREWGVERADELPDFSSLDPKALGFGTELPHWLTDTQDLSVECRSEESSWDYELKVEYFNAGDTYDGTIMLVTTNDVEAPTHTLVFASWGDVYEAWMNETGVRSCGNCGEYVATADDYMEIHAGHVGSHYECPHCDEDFFCGSVQADSDQAVEACKEFHIKVGEAYSAWLAEEGDKETWYHIEELDHIDKPSAIPFLREEEPAAEPPKMGVTAWVAEDVLGVRPEWTEAQANAWIENNRNGFTNRLIELGQEVLQTLAEQAETPCE